MKKVGVPAEEVCGLLETRDIERGRYRRATGNLPDGAPRYYLCGLRTLGCANESME